MTSVNDIADFARILREQPEWAETIRTVLLSRELLELPERFAQYAASTDRRLEALERGQEELRAGQARLEQALAQFMDSTNRRLEALEAGQAVLQAGQGELRAGQAVLQAGQGELRTGQHELRTGQDELRTGQDELRTGQDELRTGQDELRAGQHELRTGHDELRTGQDELRTVQDELRTGQDDLRTGQDELRTGQDDLRAGQDELRAGQHELRTDIEELRAGQARLEQRLEGFSVDAMNRRFEVLENGLQDVRRDLAPLKGAHARGGALQATRRIARTMNCRQVRLLNDDDLYDLLNSGDADDIQLSERRSFEHADIVIEAEHRETGETHYIAVEASFTAHEDDTRRALRNAGYLARLTGQPSHAVVAAAFVDPAVEPTFAGGRVHWYEIERRHLEPD
jgi:chromosome segregation ATPase